MYVDDCLSISIKALVSECENFFLPLCIMLDISCFDVNSTTIIGMIFGEAKQIIKKGHFSANFK